MNISQKNEFVKICRHCHTLYKSLDQKFCGNGCEREKPYLIDGKINNQIEPRVIYLPKRPKLVIRWMCINCKQEYNTQKITKQKFNCLCGEKNNFYPFTIKKCANEECKQEDEYHLLPLEAKACDLCGKTEFLLNNKKITSDFMKFIPKTAEPWKNFREFNFEESLSNTNQNTQQLSITFTILNNNLEYILYGESKNITLRDLLLDGNGYISENFSLSILEKYGLEQSLFSINFNSEKKKYCISSVFQYKLVELDAKYNPKTELVKFSSKTVTELEENKLYYMQADFFKIHIWVY